MTRTLVTLRRAALQSGREGRETAPSHKIRLAIHEGEGEGEALIYQGYGQGLDTRLHVMLAERLGKQFREVVRAENKPHKGFYYPQTVLRDLEHVLEYMRKKSGRSVDLIGYSAGGSAASAIAYKHQVEHMLIIAPSKDAREEYIQEGIKQFRGELHVLVAGEDTIVGVEWGHVIYGMAKKTSLRTIEDIPHADHFFNGYEREVCQWAINAVNKSTNTHK